MKDQYKSQYPSHVDTFQLREYYDRNQSGGRNKICTIAAKRAADFLNKWLTLHWLDENTNIFVSIDDRTYSAGSICSFNVRIERYPDGKCDNETNTVAYEIDRTWKQCTNASTLEKDLIASAVILITKESLHAPPAPKTETET